MATKIKQPSKIAKLTAEFRAGKASQEDINASVDQRLKDLEDIGLSLATALKQVTAHLISNTESNNTASKLKVEDNTEDDQSNILQKLYNFMVLSAEKREKKRELLKAKKKQERTQKLMRMKKSFKKAVREKITPTTGGLLKTLGFGLIGGAIGGLVWVFQDEIKKYAESLKSSVLDFKNFLVEKFKIISGFFKFLSDKISPITNWFSKKAKGFAQSAMKLDTSQGIYEGIKKWVIEFVTDFVTKSIDAVTGWLSDVGKSIAQWATTPFDPDTYKKIMATLATRLILGPGAALGIGAIGAADTISGGIDKAKTFMNRERYGEQYMSKVGELIQTNPYQLRKGSQESSVNEVISQIESGDTSKFKVGLNGTNDDILKQIQKQKQIMKELSELKKQNYAEKFKSYGYEYVGPTSPDMPDAGFFRNESGDVVSLEQANEKLVQLKLKKEIMDSVKTKATELSDKYLKPIVQPAEEIYKDLNTEFDNVISQLQKADRDFEIRKTVKDTATRALDTATETVTEAHTAFKEETAGDVTTTDSMISAMSLAERGLDKTISTTATLAGKGMEKLKPTLEKLYNMDYEKEAVDSYTTMQKFWGKVSEMGQTFSDPNKVVEFMDKLTGEPQTPNRLSAPEPISSPTIQADPNENLLLKNIMDQVNQSVVTNQTTVNNNSSSQDMPYESPYARNSNDSVRRSSFHNTSPWDFPFSFSR